MKKLTLPLAILFITSFMGACSPDSMLGPGQEYAYLTGDGTNQGVGGDGTNQGIRHN
ncbi:MAG: hypothetical protein O3B41_11325 [Bacteroidetes bacterium]|nr:hypothetical protein [Bacteroidota bacterium]